MLLIYPVLAQVAWTLVVLVLVARSRVVAVRAKQVRIGQIALGNDAWPDRVKAIGNNFANQFETPVLFYVLCGVATFVGATHWAVVVLAWVYVVTRIAHTLVHIGSNHVGRRFNIFGVGVACLFLMLGFVVARLL